MNPNVKKIRPWLLCKALAVLLIPCAVSVSKAVPYASELSNSGGVVSFRLNESADNVKVIWNGGSSSVDLGPRAAGVVSANISVSGAYRVDVTKSTAPIPYLISADTNPLVKFYSPRGLTVNTNPASPYFGKVYVANSGFGTSGGRTVDKGIYKMNSDLTGDDQVYTAGISFAASASSPFRIGFGEDDKLYINDFASATAMTWQTDGDLNAAQQVLSDIGMGNPTVHTDAASTPVVKGSLANGDLRLYNTDGTHPGSNNWVLRWDIAAGPLPYAQAPTDLGPVGLETTAGLTCDLDVARDGKIYVSFNRSAGTDFPSLRVYDATGTNLLWHSMQLTTNLLTTNAFGTIQVTNTSPQADPLRQIQALMLSPDGTKLAYNRTDNQIWILPLTNGIPNYSARTVITNTPTTGNGRDFAWDAAGNVYAVSSGQGLLRVYSLGGTTTASTTSSGTFSISTPQTVVSATNSTATVAEGSSTSFTLTRTGDTASSLSVGYTVAGTASNGVDFATLSGSVTFAPGAVSTNVTVQTQEDAVAETTETIVLTVAGSPNYAIGSASSTISILDNETPELSITATQPRLLENYSFGTAIFQVRRLGLLSGSLTANVSYSGTATIGVDFNGPATVTLAANAVSTNFSITPVNNTVYNGSKSIVATLASGAGYVVGATNSATATLIDDENPTGTVLFFDNFDTDTSVNWSVNSADGFLDTSVDWAYDYGQSGIGIPPAPHSVGNTTRGVRLRADYQFGSAVGLSISPLNVHFTNDFRLTFDAWINYNGPLAVGGSGSTTSGNAGLATSGFMPQWSGGSAGNSGTQDGIWFSWNSDGDVAAGDAGIRDYAAYVPVSPSPLAASTGVYVAGTSSTARDCADPFYAVWGRATAPAAQLAAYPGPTKGQNQTGTVRDGALGMSWHTMSLTKLGTNVTWSIDGVVVATVDISQYLPIDEFGNTLSGIAIGDNISLGHDDTFNGVSDNPEVNFQLFDNVKVETIVAPPAGSPVITGIQKVGNNIVINFTGDGSDSAANFTLVGASTLSTGSFSPVAGAVITGSGGSFQATAPISGSTMFYRIQR